MGAKIDQFSARDAFIYTDTYRQAIKLNAAAIATDKERLKERIRRGGGRDSAYYAELRALEHAMNHVVRSEEPKRVLLGEADGTTEAVVDHEAQLTAQLVEVQRQLGKEKLDKEKLKGDLKTVGDAYATLQARAAELSQLVVRLTRKVERTSSTFGVIIFAMSVVIVGLLFALGR
jgi:chromosome segregation ATPase